MSALYIETSALLTWLFGEPQGEKILSQINSADTLLSSIVTSIEVERALHRAEKLKVLKATDCQKLRGISNQLLRGCTHMELSEEVQKRSSESFPIEPIRTLDAIHLATAVVFSQAYPDMKMLSLDNRIIENAQSLGLI